ncbi:MAG: S-formylglutathione hydrolase [Pseudomonadota bacterium]
MQLQVIAEELCFDGTQGVYEHESTSCACPMRFAVFRPRQASAASPVLFWLSGLTCTEQNFITKAGAQRTAAELGLVIVAPDTSPRGDDVPDDPEGSYDFGLGAGFYVDATEQPWSTHYQMHSYISAELPALVADAFGLSTERVAVAGHSMGGHGALTMHFRHPQRFVSVSAFAPIVAPTRVPWGQKALAGYLGDDRECWSDYDSCELVRRAPTDAHILIDQGTADDFLERELRTDLFVDACRDAGQRVTARMRDGYTHSYFFVSSFIDEHLRHHTAALTA